MEDTNKNFMFTPQIYGKDRMILASFDTLTQRERQLAETLAKHLFSLSLNSLEEKIKKKEDDKVIVPFTLDVLKKAFEFNTDAFVDFAVRREFINLAEAHKMKTYPYGPTDLILTY